MAREANLEHEAYLFEGDKADTAKREWDDHFRRDRSVESFLSQMMYDQVISRAIEHENGKDQSYYYGILKDGRTVAILHMVHKSRGRKVFKVLDITVAPWLEIDDEGFTEDQVWDSAIAVMCAVIASFSLSVQSHPSKTMKIYARTEHAKFVFSSFLALKYEKQGQPIQVRMEGRWLVFEYPD